MGMYLTKGFTFHSEKLREIDVLSDLTTFLLNLNIGKHSALNKLSNLPPIPPKKLLGFAPIPWVHLAEVGGVRTPGPPWPATPLYYTD